LFSAITGHIATLKPPALKANTRAKALYGRHGFTLSKETDRNWHLIWQNRP